MNKENQAQPFGVCLCKGKNLSHGEGCHNTYYGNAWCNKEACDRKEKINRVVNWLAGLSFLVAMISGGYAIEMQSGDAGKIAAVASAVFVFVMTVINRIGNGDDYFDPG